MSINQTISKEQLVNFQQKKIYNTKEVSEFVDHSKAQLEIIPSDNSQNNLDTELKLFKQIFDLMFHRLNKSETKHNKNKLQKKFRGSITDIKKVRKEAQIPHRIVSEPIDFEHAQNAFETYNNMGSNNLFDQSGAESGNTTILEEVDESI